MGLKSAGGEIVQVQGGHIIRATGRKDRHSKVFTAKGPRDRRVRLSAHTAIQFYDVQDRLGYDRPSKAVDWLIKKAKASIDKLAKLPPWDPCATTAPNNVPDVGGCAETAVADHTGSYHHQLQAQQAPDAYAPQAAVDCMKSLFPTSTACGGGGGGGVNSMSFQNYPHHHLSSTQTQDLCLSLHTHQTVHQGHHEHDQTLFQGSGFDVGGSSGWAEPHQQPDMGRFMRMMGWAGGGGGSSDPLPPQALLLGQQQGPTTAAASYSQRGTLQSSFSPLVRVLEDQHQHHHHNVQQHQLHPSISGSDGFMGFLFPSQQIHGGELHGGGGSMSNNRASSSTSLSPDSSQH